MGLGGSACVAWIFNTVATLQEPDQCVLPGCRDLIQIVSWKPKSSILIASSRNGKICSWDLKKQPRVKRNFGGGQTVYFISEPLSTFELVSGDEDIPAAVDMKWTESGDRIAVGFDNGVIAVLEY